MTDRVGTVVPRNSAQNGEQPRLPLFLHIGLPKTGSTSLQLRLFENAEALKQKGYLYPLGRFSAPKFQHSEMADLVSAPRLDALRSLLAGMHDEASSSACHTVILSGENFYPLAQPRLGLLRDAILSAGFTPTVVAFFRPDFDYLRSLGSQKMKESGYIVVPSKLAKNVAAFDRNAVEARFASVFGASNVIRHDLSNDEDCVPLFDRDIGLVADFAGAWHNARVDFATLSWLNAIKTELGLSSGVAHRLLARAFKGSPPLLAAEAAFLSEIADLVGGEKRDALKAELSKRIAKNANEFQSHQARLDYLVRFHRFVGMLRRYMWRKVMRRRLWALLGRPYPKDS